MDGIFFESCLQNYRIGYKSVLVFLFLFLRKAVLIDVRVKFFSLQRLLDHLEIGCDLGFIRPR